MYKFCGNRGKFINFVEIWEYAICIIDLGGWTPLIISQITKIQAQKSNSA